MARHWLSDALGDGPVTSDAGVGADTAGTAAGRRRRERAPERRPSNPVDDVTE